MRLLIAVPAAAALLLLPATASAASSPQPRPLAPGSALCLLHSPPAGLCGQHVAATSPAPPAQAPAAIQPAANAWTIVASPNLPGGLRNSLADTACLSASNCWAVGEQRSATDYSSPLLEHWNGSSWTITPSSAPAGALNTSLYSVACPSASNCWAVGLYTTQGGGSAPVGEHWEGTSWTVANPPAPTGAPFGGLRGITCLSDTDCRAVGFWYDNGDFKALIERWDGASWSIVASPPTSAGTSVGLNGVACSSSSDCWAVGSSNAGSANQAVVEHWDGTVWTAGTAATPTGNGGDELTGVACTSAALCWAAGDYTLTGAGTSQMLIQQWNGASWTVVTASDASPLTAAALSKVTCVSATDCLAAGYTSATGGGQIPLVEEWQGSSWSSDGLAAPSGATGSTLAGIACSSGSCWSVGTEMPSATYPLALVEHQTAGTWNAGTTPVPQGTQVNALNAVTCVSGADCIAVGSHTTGPTAATLVEVWDGGAWSAVPSASVGGGQHSFLNAVTCVSASDCWAVGDSQPNTGNTAATLTEHWDGSNWVIVPSPNPTGAQISVLSSVACASAADCWAVGYSFQVATNGVIVKLPTGPIAIAQTLIERWNGQSWAIVSSPNTNPAESNALESVTCVASTDCWAIGFDQGTQLFEGLVEHWNGSAWQIVTSPQTAGTQSSGLFGVACTSAASCWTVGYSYLGSGASAHSFQTYIEHWDGNAWAVVASPNFGPDNVDALFAVTCAGATNCWAVGAYGSGPIYATLTVQWDGSAWTTAGSENPAASQGAELFGVACAGGSECWSTGAYNGSDGTLQTLVEVSGLLPAGQVPEAPAVWLLLVAAIPGLAGVVRRRRQGNR